MVDSFWNSPRFTVADASPFERKPPAITAGGARPGVTRTSLPRPRGLAGEAVSSFGTRPPVQRLPCRGTTGCEPAFPGGRGSIRKKPYQPPRKVKGRLTMSKSRGLSAFSYYQDSTRFIPYGQSTYPQGDSFFCIKITFLWITLEQTGNATSREGGREVILRRRPRPFRRGHKARENWYSGRRRRVTWTG